MSRVVLVLAFTATGLAAGCKREPGFRDAAPRPPPGALRGTYSLTYYWIASQPSDDVPDTTLYTKRCEPAAKVSAAYATEVLMSGTGTLTDSRVLGVAGDCECKKSPCVRVLAPEYPWGVGVENRPLVPFVSLAVDRDVIAIGTSLYIAELDGAVLPGLLARHDGCVVADDIGARIKGTRIDWFVGTKPSYAALDAQLKLTRVTVHDGGAWCPGKPPRP